MIVDGNDTILDMIVVIYRLKKIEQENEAEEKGRGQVTAELRIKKTQHMTASRYLLSKHKPSLKIRS